MTANQTESRKSSFGKQETGDISKKRKLKIKKKTFSFIPVPKEPNIKTTLLKILAFCAIRIF